MNVAETPVKLKKQNYFPTMIFSLEVDNAEALNMDLLAAIYAERKEDQKGINRSNIPALGGWHSKNYLHNSPNYADLVNWIGVATRNMSEELGFSKDHEINIGTMWSIINPPGSSNIAHIHPGCLWSGVYYVQAPEGSGKIEFTDPRTMHMMNQPKYLANTRRKLDCWTKVNFTPVAGKMIIFPAWLYHAVATNTSKETGEAGQRIIISFNLNQNKK